MLLRDKGADLFRIKGVLAVKGVPGPWLGVVNELELDAVAAMAS